MTPTCSATTPAIPMPTSPTRAGPGIQGKLLTCKKGDWALGQDEHPAPAAARFLFVIDTMMRGG